MAKRGRPKKDHGKTYFTGVRLTERELNELREFSMLSRMSMSSFIRDAINMKIDTVRSKYGFIKLDDADYYECFEDEDGEDTEEEDY